MKNAMGDRGRGLDRWLAERVMGWRYIETLLNREKIYIASEDDAHYIVHMHAEDWRPTQQIEHAFRVVEEMESCLHLKQHGKTGRWSAMFCDCMDGHIEAETASLAICLAARKAVG